MLFSLALSSLLAAASVAASSGPHSRVLALCDAAPNCETFVNAQNVTSVRFKDGMGPGSPFYNDAISASRVEKTSALRSRAAKLWRRDMVTTMTVSDTHLDYGDQRPSDVIAGIKAVCPDSGFCTEEPIYIGATSASPTNTYGVTLAIVARGQYRDADDRDNFLAAILEAATQGTQESDKEWSHLTYGGNAASGTVHTFRQTDFIGVHRLDEGGIQGWMEVSITQDSDSGSGWCSVVTGILGAVAGSVNGIAGGFFGVASAFCSV